MSSSAPSSPSPTQRLTDRKREAIIQAAVDEFLASGFAATSMDRIAARAEVSKRTVYNHFASKDELFAEILMHMLDCCAGDLEHPYRADQPLHAQLLALLESKLRMFEDARFLDFVRVAIAEAVHSPERARAMIERIGEREEGVTAWIRAAQADGRLIDVDPAFAAMQLQGLVKTFAFWPQIAFGQPTLTPAMQRQVAESTAAMFLAHYAVRQEETSR